LTYAQNRHSRLHRLEVSMLRVGTPLGTNSLPRARLILIATAFLRLRTDLMRKAGVIVEAGPSQRGFRWHLPQYLSQFGGTLRTVSEHRHAGPARLAPIRWFQRLSVFPHLAASMSPMLNFDVASIISFSASSPSSMASSQPPRTKPGRLRPIKCGAENELSTQQHDVHQSKFWCSTP
jgi:hypothetical protein